MEHIHKKQDVYTIGKQLWNETKSDDTTYQSPVKDLKMRGAGH